MKTLTMVARQGRKEEKFDRIYLLIDENYRMLKVEPKEIRDMLISGVVITNMGMEDGKLISTNGAMDKYTRIDAQNIGLIGKPSPVVLNRVEKGEDLIGYTIYTIDGTLKEVSVRDAVAVHKRTPFANGKLRDTQGGEIISSINGKYPLRTLSLKKANEKSWDIEMKVMFAATVVKGLKKVTHAGIMLTFDSAVDYTKIHNAIEADRSAFLDDLKRMGVSSLAPYETQRMKSGFYTVVPVEALEALIKKGGAKVNKKVIPIVSAVEFSGEDFNESILKLDKSFEIEKAVKVREDLDNYAVEVYKELIKAIKK